MRFIIQWLFLWDKISFALISLTAFPCTLVDKKKDSNLWLFNFLKDTRIKISVGKSTSVIRFRTQDCSVLDPEQS
jgi:hypothetical protein